MIYRIRLYERPHPIYMWFLAIIVLMTACTMVLSSTAKASERAAGRAYTMQVCELSHDTISGAAEQACGDAQDKYNLEFLCSATDANAACWLEDK